jgi:hypothetical protein
MHSPRLRHRGDDFGGFASVDTVVLSQRTVAVSTLVFEDFEVQSRIPSGGVSGKLPIQF